MDRELDDVPDEIKDEVYLIRRRAKEKGHGVLSFKRAGYDKNLWVSECEDCGAHVTVSILGPVDNEL